MSSPELPDIIDKKKPGGVAPHDESATSRPQTHKVPTMWPSQPPSPEPGLPPSERDEVTTKHRATLSQTASFTTPRTTTTTKFTRVLPTQSEPIPDYQLLCTVSSKFTSQSAYPTEPGLCDFVFYESLYSGQKNRLGGPYDDGFNHFLEGWENTELGVSFSPDGAALTLVPTMEGNRAASSAENEKHKTHWSDDETRALLKVWEDHLSDLRKTKRNLKVYVAIAECLRAQGVEKSVKEIKSKIENLGNRYRNLSRKTTGQGAITWRFYKDISRFLGSLPMNDSSLTEETCGEDATVEIIIHSMEHGPLGEEDSQPPPASPDECSHNTSTLYLPSSPYSTDDCWAQPQAEVNSQQNNQTSRRTTQKTLLAQLVATNRQLCADLNESRKQELELRRMELDIVRESAATEKLLTDALVKYLAK